MQAVVVGGGAAGLGAAWELRQAGVGVTLLDQNEDLGGRCRSHYWSGHWCIRGAAAFVGGEEEPVQLSKALGIYDESRIVDSKEENDFTVLHGDKGAVNIGSFSIPDILRSRVIPFREKMALAAVLPKFFKAALRHKDRDPTTAVAWDDENACDYFRRYAPSFVDYMLEPIMNQYCGYGEDDYSLAWLLWLMGSTGSWSDTAWTYQERGVGALSSALQERFVGDEHCGVVTCAEVTQVSMHPDLVAVEYSVAGAKLKLEADAVVVAVPGSRVNDIMPALDAERRAFFASVEYISHHIFHTIVDTPADPGPFSLLFPTAEGFEVVSNIWIKPHHIAGQSVLYGEIKGRFCRENRGLSDVEIIDAAWAEICRALPQYRTANRHDFHLQRNDIGLCSRRKGYTRSLQKFYALPPLARVAFAGDYLINSTVGQSLYSGKVAAQQLLQ